MTTLRRVTVQRMAWMLTSLAVLLGVAGFWFDTDPQATILGKYSAYQAVRILLVTGAGCLAILLLRLLLLPLKVLLPNGPRIIPFRVKLSVTTVLLVASAAAAEGVLRWRDLETRLEKRRSSAVSFDPFLQIVPPRNDKRLHVNRWAFRGEDLEIEKPAGTYRIFVVGGSTVYNAVIDWEHTHPRLLEQQLRQRYPGLRIEVQNAGMDWQTSKHSLMKILFSIQDFDPDMIVIYHAINDLYRSCSPEEFAEGPYRSDYSHFLGPVNNMVRDYFHQRTWPGMLRDYFQQPTWPRMMTMERASAFAARHWFTDFRDAPQSRATDGLSEVSVSDWPSLAAFRRNMTDIVTLVRAKDIDLVIASQPYLYREDLNEMERGRLWFPRAFCRQGRSKPSISSMIRGMDAFNDASRQVADSHGVLFIDLERQVPKTLEYFTDDVHYTDEGNRVIGQYFAQRIIAKGYIPRKFPAIAGIGKAGATELRSRTDRSP